MSSDEAQLGSDEAARGARIWIRRGDAGPSSVALGEGLSIGRGDHCDLVLEDGTVSWDHAELSRHGVSYLLTDLGSRNGTLVNGRTVERPTRLRRGDVVQVGPYRLELDLPRLDRTQPAKAISVLLTEDERAVAAALAAPYRSEGVFAARPPGVREIAAQLHTSESSVKRRLTGLAAKLEVSDAPPGDRARLIADRVIALGLDRA